MHCTKIYFFLILSLTILASSLQGQGTSDNFFYKDFIYFDHIKSVQFGHGNLQQSFPIIDLNSRGSLSLSFDDMEGGDKIYTYAIVHCTKNWERSELEDIEYMDGYNGEEIEDFEYSISTILDYTNYSLRIPNDELEWNVSGNYVLIIYEGDDDDKIPVITRRFMVIENVITIGVKMENPFNVSLLRTHHKLNFFVTNKNFRITNPINELYAVVLQNNRWDNAIENVSPKFQTANQIQWNQTDLITFPAQKEFRNFDTRTLRSTSEFVHSIDITYDAATVLLHITEPRTNRNFLSDTDINGKFILANDDFDNDRVRSEYSEVIFTLDPPYKYDKDIYIIGKFTDWEAREPYKMRYDEERKVYIGSCTLKQGYYNYLYGMIDDDGKISTELLEGNWYETENEYTVLMYYSEFGARYDRLIGMRTIVSSR